MGRLRRVMAENDRGITLVEVLVAAFLGILILLMLGNLFISTLRGSAVASTADTNTRQASNAMNSMTRYLHAATEYPVASQTSPLPAFDTISSTDVTFYAYVNLTSTDAKPVKVRFFLDSSKNLVQQLWNSTCSATTGYCTFATAVSSQVVLGGKVASPNGDGAALFTFLNSGGSETSDRASISSVVVNLELGSITPKTPGNARMVTTVGLLNLGQSGASE